MGGGNHQGDILGHYTVAPRDRFMRQWSQCELIMVANKEEMVEMERNTAGLRRFLSKGMNEGDIAQEELLCLSGPL